MMQDLHLSPAYLPPSPDWEIRGTISYANVHVQSLVWTHAGIPASVHSAMAERVQRSVDDSAKAKRNTHTHTQPDRQFMPPMGPVMNLQDQFL